MEITNFKLDEAEFRKIQLILSSLCDKAGLSVVFLINRNGQEIARHGESNGVDSIALASLAASNLAATFGLSAILGEQEFAHVYLRGDRLSALITPAGEYALLMSLISQEEQRTLSLERLAQAALVLEDVLGKCTTRVKVIEKVRE